MKSGFMDMMLIVGVLGLSINAGRKAKGRTEKDGAATSQPGCQTHPKGATTSLRTRTSYLPQDGKVSASGQSHNASAVKVLLAGHFQNGKSTLINCLLGGDFAIEGDGCHTTAHRTVYMYSKDAPKYFKVLANGKREILKDGLSQTIRHDGCDACFEAHVSSPVLKKMTLIDAPGWGANGVDDRQAELSLDDAVFVVYLAQAKQLSDDDKNFMKLLRERRKLFCVLLNARDCTDPLADSLQDICGAIVGKIKQIGLDGQFIKYPSATGLGIVNLVWAKFGMRLLDSPKTDIAKQQAETVRMAFRDDESANGEIDYEEVLRDSELPSWTLFLDSCLEYVTRFAPPVRCAIHEAISSSICAGLIKIIKEG